MTLGARLDAGFTLAELMIVVAIVGLLGSVAVPSYSSYIDNINIEISKANLRVIEQRIGLHLRTSDTLPASLEVIGLASLTDAWGNPYRYLPFDDDTPQGKMRKDKNLVPVNSDYDLYSMGRDGRTTAPFTSKHGRDDIVRANNGNYYGLAEDY